MHGTLHISTTSRDAMRRGTGRAQIKRPLAPQLFGQLPIRAAHQFGSMIHPPRSCRQADETMAFLRTVETDRLAPRTRQNAVHHWARKRIDE